MDRSRRAREAHIAHDVHVRYKQWVHIVLSRTSGTPTPRANTALPPPAPTANPAGRGSFVLPQDEGETRRRLLARLDAQLDDAVATARLAGIDLSEFHERSGQRWTATNKK